MNVLTIAAVLGAACGLMIGVVLLVGGRVWHRSAVVKAQSFQVVDAAGNVRAELGIASGEMGMAFMGLSDVAGRIRASLSVTSDGSSSLALLDATETARVGLSLYPDGSGHLALLNAAQGVRKALVELGVGSDGKPSLDLCDAAGHVIWSAP